MSGRASGAAQKDERLNLRISADEKATLERASRSLRISTSEFIIREAMVAAEVVLAERNRFVLPADQWSAFAERLDQPPRVIQPLAELRDKPSPFSEPEPAEAPTGTALVDD